MIARPYANLLPERFRQPFNAALLVVAAGCLISIVIEYLTAIPTPWALGVQNLMFFMLGLNYLIWPNGSSTVSPLATRVIGGGLVAVLLFSFATHIIRHL